MYRQTDCPARVATAPTPAPMRKGSIIPTGMSFAMKYSTMTAAITIAMMTSVFFIML